MDSQPFHTLLPTQFLESISVFGALTMARFQSKPWDKCFLIETIEPVAMSRKKSESVTLEKTGNRVKYANNP
jgi:hypothetical protein